MVCRLRFSVLVPDDSHLSWLSEVVALVCSGLLDGFAEQAGSVVMALARGESHSVALNHSVDRLDCSAEPAECSAGFHFQIEYPAEPV
jgi:hypothetical protein